MEAYVCTCRSVQEVAISYNLRSASNFVKNKQVQELASTCSGQLDADYHDKVLALTSHLPHLIAYTIVATAVDLESQLKNDVIRFSASGFRDSPALPRLIR